MCDISVIVTVYNKKQYIEQCVRTLISVCGAVVEIILVDDGSTDGTADILTNIALWDDRIKVIHKENGGESSARLAGLYASKGSYIIFVDADDWIDSLDWYQFDRQILQNVNNIIIYGAGRVGKCYYRQFEKDSNINIDAWVDVNYLHYEEAGLPVSNIDIIQNYSDDMIIIAVDNSRAAIQIKKNLLSRFNISEEKMIWIKPKNIIDDMCNELLEDN